MPVERLLFEADAPGTYRLTYGSADRPAPVYDLARTAGDLEAWAEAARPGAWVRSVGGRARPATTSRGPSATPRSCGPVSWPWSLALGGLTLAALRRAG